MQYSTVQLSINGQSLLIFQILIDSLQRFSSSVKVCVVDGDADPAVITLAHHYRCPVVSDDNDFLLCDLQGGVISARQMVEQICRL